LEVAFVLPDIDVAQWLHLALKFPLASVGTSNSSNTLDVMVGL